MEELRVAVCEDSPEEQDKLLGLIGESGFSAQVSSFSSGEAFLAKFRPGKYDLIFMDIYMGGITGVETVAAIRQLDENVPIAFATTSTEHTLESYRLDVLKYIEKPVTEKAVRSLLELASLKKENRPHLMLRSDGGEVKLPLERILCVEQRGHELLFSLTGGETLRTPEKLDALEGTLAGHDFYRCHKSYLVNLAYIESLDRELMVFEMKEGKPVHIRRESLGDARKAYESYLFGRARGQADE